MAATVDDVRYVAELARLEFNEEQAQKLTHDLNNILQYVDKLNEIDTEDMDVSVNPVYIENAFRDDDEAKSLDREDVLLNAPDRQDGYFKVPKIIEG